MIVWGIFMTGIIIINGIHVTRSMNAIMRKPKKITAALTHFASQRVDIPNKPLFIFNADQPTSCGILQATQLFHITTALPKFFLSNLFINKEISAKDVPLFVKLVIHPNTIEIQSKCRSKLWFLLSCGTDEPLIYTKRTIVNQQIVRLPFYLKNITSNDSLDGKFFNLKLYFEQKYFSPDVIVAALFLNEEQFVILNKHAQITL